jgi:hypothetical protein
MAKKTSSWCAKNYVDYQAILKADKIKTALEQIYKKMGFKMSTCGRNPSLVIQCILKSLYNNVAKLLPDGSYQNLRSSQVNEY